MAADYFRMLFLYPEYHLWPLYHRTISGLTVRILPYQLNNNFLTVNIPGSISIGCGKFTDIYLASPDTTNGINELKEDPHFGGTYFNLRVRHCFKVGGEYITSIEMSKDAFQDKTFQEKLKK